MRKKFNIMGRCNPEKHYMVNMEARMAEIKVLIEEGAYFSINRARQYGKTTLLHALKQNFQSDYVVISLDFQFLSQESFKSEYMFASAFSNQLIRTLCSISGLNENIMYEFEDCAKNGDHDLRKLFEHLSDLCATADKPILLFIDEVDSASNNQVFLDFLAQLRGYYIHREERPIFQSVILAGVYDVKNLRLKMRPDLEHKVNSPWNIAAEFNVDMSFSAADISGMLTEYESDHKTGMDIRDIAKLIYDYTAGYPFLVSRICKIIDEKIMGNGEYADLNKAWTKNGIVTAVKVLESEKNTLFESLVNKLTDFPELREVIYSLLFHGKTVPFNPLNREIEIASMFGFIKESEGLVVVANRIFETILYNLFLSEEVVSSAIYSAALQDRNQFILNGRLDIDLVMKKFVQYFSELYSDSTEKFIEDAGRRLFLLYLKPIINGNGNYYIESRTRDMRRTDIIVDYHGQQFVIETKIWHGEEYNRRGEEQLAGYLDDYHFNKGCLLSFNFNKNKKVGVKEIICKDKVIVEAVV